MERELCRRIADNIAKVIVGQDQAVDLLLTALLAEGHIIIEDVPGLGKTLLAKALARSIGGGFKRVQFTPDLLPADITGFTIYDQPSGRFRFQPGPVMTNVLLADEINRTIPRTQASLLESMEERQVTVDGTTHPLPRPFLVIATQNPIELEGTFPLPEAQLDRFLIKIRLGYPSEAEENAILARFQEEDPYETLTAVATPEDLTTMQQACRKIHVAAPIREYVTRIVQATRRHPALRFGASPRGSLGLLRAAQAQALLAGRDHVLPDDVKRMTGPVLAHRLLIKEEERLRGETARRPLTEVVDETDPPLTAGHDH